MDIVEVKKDVELLKKDVKRLNEKYEEIKNSNKQITSCSTRSFNTWDNTDSHSPSLNVNVLLFGSMPPIPKLDETSEIDTNVGGGLQESLCKKRKLNDPSQPILTQRQFFKILSDKNFTTFDWEKILVHRVESFLLDSKAKDRISVKVGAKIITLNRCAATEKKYQMDNKMPYYAILNNDRIYQLKRFLPENVDWDNCDKSVLGKCSDFYHSVSAKTKADSAWLAFLLKNGNVVVPLLWDNKYGLQYEKGPFNRKAGHLRVSVTSLDFEAIGAKGPVLEEKWRKKSKQPVVTAGVSTVLVLPPNTPGSILSQNSSRILNDGSVAIVSCELPGVAVCLSWVYIFEHELEFQVIGMPLEDKDYLENNECVQVPVWIAPSPGSISAKQIAALTGKLVDVDAITLRPHERKHLDQEDRERLLEDLRKLDKKEKIKRPEKESLSEVLERMEVMAQEFSQQKSAIKQQQQQMAQEFSQQKSIIKQQQEQIKTLLALVNNNISTTAVVNNNSSSTMASNSLGGNVNTIPVS